MSVTRLDFNTTVPFLQTRTFYQQTQMMRTLTVSLCGCVLGVLWCWMWCCKHSMPAVACCACMCLCVCCLCVCVCLVFCCVVLHVDHRSRSCCCMAGMFFRCIPHARGVPAQEGPLLPHALQLGSALSVPSILPLCCINALLSCVHKSCMVSNLDTA